jgi:hypothetical protein
MLGGMLAGMAGGMLASRPAPPSGWLVGAVAGLAAVGYSYLVTAAIGGRKA